MGLGLSRFKNKHFMALLGNAVISMFGLFILALLYRAFSKDDMGTWLFFMATLSVFDAIRNGFLGTATIKFYAGAEPARAADVLGSVWYLAIALTVITLLLNAIALPFIPYIHNYQIIVSIKWVGLTILSSLPYSVVFWKLQADERYDTILWMRLVNSGSTIIAFLLLHFTGHFSLDRALLWNFLTNSFTSVIGMVARLGGGRYFVNRTRATILEIVHFGKYSLATNLSSNLLRTVDVYVVTFLLGPGAVAVLSLPARLMELVEIPLRSFIGTGMSSMAVAFNQKNMKQFTQILNKYAGMLTIAFVPMAIAVLFLADIPVNLLSSGKYRGTEAANIYRIVMFISLIYPIDRFNGVALDLIHQPKINFQKVQVMLVFKLVGNLVFITMLHSIYGAPLAGFFTMIAGLGFGYVHLRKYTEFSIRDILRTGLSETRLLLKTRGR